MKIVILAGGTGTRFWPASREKLPKQFLSLTNEYTMLQNTLFRIKNFGDNINKEYNIFIICNKDHSHIIDLQVNELNIQNITIYKINYY